MPKQTREQKIDHDVQMFFVRFQAFIEQQRQLGYPRPVVDMLQAFEAAARDLRLAWKNKAIARLVVEVWTPTSFAELEALAEEARWQWEDAMGGADKSDHPF